jgi:hypothetical protein
VNVFLGIASFLLVKVALIGALQRRAEREFTSHVMRDVPGVTATPPEREHLCGFHDGRGRIFACPRRYAQRITLPDGKNVVGRGIFCEHPQYQ